MKERLLPEPNLRMKHRKKTPSKSIGELNPLSKRKNLAPVAREFTEIKDVANSITLKFIVSYPNTWPEFTWKALKAWLPSSVAGLHKVATSGGVFAQLQVILLISFLFRN